MSEVRVVPVRPEDAEALVALFQREGSPCYCRYWHFAGTNKEWEERCGLAPERSRAELEAALAAGSDEARGLVAHLETSAGALLVGWMKLAPQRTLPKLLARVPYRGLEHDGVFSIGCFLVDPGHRQHGIAGALVDGAIEWAPRWGATHLEAYPRVADGLHAGEMWTGPRSVFASRGFQVVRESPQYPVLRRPVR